jgi:RimJ/RimL family protein N-acetyltransferase
MAEEESPDGPGQVIDGVSAADLSSPDGPGASHGSALQPLHATRMTLELGSIVLRPWREADAAALHAACQDAEIARWVSIPQPYALGDARAFIAESELMWRDGSGAAFAIVDAASGRLAGAVTRFGPDGHVATLGCWLAREARGRGIGWRALRAVADWTFRSTYVIRIDCYIMLGNEASERMVRRAGFQREGVLRAWDLLRGTPVDCVAYSLLRSDEAAGETP